MNLLNKLFNKEESNKKGDELRSRLKECINRDDATEARDHINPDEYMEFLAQYKAKYFDVSMYTTSMDDIDKSMVEVKHDELVDRLRNIINK